MIRARAHYSQELIIRKSSLFARALMTCTVERSYYKAGS